MIPAQMGLPGLATALKGAKMGSRIVAVLPPKYGYGTSWPVAAADHRQRHPGLGDRPAAAVLGQRQSASGSQVSHGGGTLPTVTAKAGQAPVITVPKNSPPSKLSVTTLIKGTGPKLAKGDTVVVASTSASIWRTGKVFGTLLAVGARRRGQPVQLPARRPRC